jgi:hypothetical protein
VALPALAVAALIFWQNETKSIKPEAHLAERNQKARSSL